MSSQPETLEIAETPETPETAEIAETPETAKTGIEGRYDRIVWIDCEMTGLDLSRDVLVEIACIVTDAELNELDEGYTSVIATDEATLATMQPRVTELHQESGLLPLIAGGISLEQAAAETLAYIKTHVSEPLRAPLAGSTIYVDRGFLARQMPEVDAYLHYRVIDVSSIKELVRRWYPKVYFSAPAKTGNHRALGDIRDSIAELRYYRQTVFTAPKGSR
jgi:oligoribonuclease